MNNVSSEHERCRCAICHDFVLQNRLGCASIQIRISARSWSTPVKVEEVCFVFKDIEGFDHKVPKIRSQAERMAKEFSLAQAGDLEVLLA